MCKYYEFKMENNWLQFHSWKHTNKSEMIFLFSTAFFLALPLLIRWLQASILAYISLLISTNSVNCLTFTTTPSIPMKISHFFPLMYNLLSHDFLVTLLHWNLCLSVCLCGYLPRRSCLTIQHTFSIRMLVSIFYPHFVLMKRICTAFIADCRA